MNSSRALKRKADRELIKNSRKNRAILEKIAFDAPWIKPMREFLDSDAGKRLISIYLGNLSFGTQVVTPSLHTLTRPKSINEAWDIGNRVAAWPEFGFETLEEFRSHMEAHTQRPEADFVIVLIPVPLNNLHGEPLVLMMDRQKNFAPLLKGFGFEDLVFLDPTKFGMENQLHKRSLVARPFKRSFISERISELELLIPGIANITPQERADRLRQWLISSIVPYADCEAEYLFSYAWATSTLYDHLEALRKHIRELEAEKTASLEGLAAAHNAEVARMKEHYTKEIRKLTELKDKPVISRPAPASPVEKKLTLNETLDTLF